MAKLKSVQLRRHREGIARVEEMKKRLVSSDSPIKNICLDLGIREDSGARLFKRRTGTTMTLWRKRRSKMG